MDRYEVMAGKHNARHNTDLAYRAKLPNVDPRLSRLNLTIKDEPIGKAYDRIFGKSLSDYNAKQKSKGHGERCIADYHAKIEGAWKADSAKVDSHKKGRSNVPKPCYEYVLQLGDRDTFRKELDYETAKEIFEEAFGCGWQGRVWKVFNSGRVFNSEKSRQRHLLVFSNSL